MNDISYAENDPTEISGVFDFFIHIKDAVNNFVDHFSLADFFASIVIRYHRFHNAVLNEFGPNGVYILIIFCIFLTLIALIYAKSVADTFRAAKMQDDQTSHDGLFYTEQSEDEIMLAADQDISEEDDDVIAEYDQVEYFEEPEENQIFQNADNSVELSESEIEKTNTQEVAPPHIMAQIEKDEELSEAVIAASSPAIDGRVHLSNEYMRLKSIMQKHADSSNRKARYLDNNESLSQELIGTISIEENKNIQNMLTLILNLLGRNVSESKILQILYQKFSMLFDTNNLLQILRSIEDFIGLCNSGRLDYMPQRDKLPLNEQALFSLSKGDSTPCLALLQSFLNMEMQKAEQENGVIQEITYAQAANCACIMGNLAYLDDKPLARNAFELATELSPHNVNAWNRLADLYMEDNTVEKAMIAYQSVLDFGDEIMYPEPIANARDKLAHYYEKQGMETRASEYKQLSFDFYRDYGVLSKLTKTEEDALSLIAESSDIRETINILLPQVTAQTRA